MVIKKFTGRDRQVEVAGGGGELWAVSKTKSCPAKPADKKIVERKSSKCFLLSRSCV